MKCYLAVKLTVRLCGKTDAVSLKAQSRIQYCTDMELKLYKLPLQQNLSICHVSPALIKDLGSRYLQMQQMQQKNKNLTDMSITEWSKTRKVV